MAIACALACPASARAAEPIAVPFADIERAETPEKTYEANAFSIVHVGRDPEDRTKGWYPVRGVYRIAIDHDVFYRALGRPDLADQFAGRRATARLFDGLSYALLIAGVVVLPWQIYESHAPGAVAGGALMVSGGVMLLLVPPLQKPTLSEEDALDMVDRYNRALRRQLLPSSASTLSDASGSGGANLTISPRFGPSGLGFTIAGQF